jgi:crotonobetainyl-CoA:carnitine CoA-transferase CaiB-like acyl-CoA transferase
MGGLMWVTGMAGQGPMRAGIAVADSSAGVYAATGILVALAERERSGLGQWVQTSLLQAQIAMMDFQAARYLVDGEVPPQAGNDHPYSTPMGVMATADGYINIGVGGDAQWRALCKAVERPDLALHPDYAKQADRYHNRTALKLLLDEIFRTRTSADWLERLEADQVPAGPIYKVDEVFADEQVQHLGIAVPAHHATRGDIRIVGQPFTLSRTPAGIATMIPNAGEHTDEILREAGYSDKEISALREKEVV